MSEEQKPELNWIDAGVSAMALSDNIMKRLVAKGVLTPADRTAIIDGAIADLTSNPALAKAADNIRLIFQRP